MVNILGYSIRKRACNIKGEVSMGASDALIGQAGGTSDGASIGVTNP